MTVGENINDAMRDEARSAARYDRTRYRWVGSDLRDEADVPNRSDLADEWGDDD